MFALWCGFRTDLFRGLASVSGSLWYDGFADYVRDNEMSPAVRSIYISLGDREKNAKNPRMAAVEEASRAVAALLREKTGLPAVFELNPGGHFRDVPERIARGIRTLPDITEV